MEFLEGKLTKYQAIYRKITAEVSAQRQMAVLPIGICTKGETICDAVLVHTGVFSLDAEKVSELMKIHSSPYSYSSNPRYRKASFVDCFFYIMSMTLQKSCSLTVDCVCVMLLKHIRKRERTHNKKIKDVKTLH